MVLNFYPRSWDLNNTACPCDHHFNLYMRSQSIENQSVFHFGTGAHHIVGVENVRLGAQNHILGITVSKQEYATYMDLVTEDVELALTYKVLYADAYTLSPRILPEFDVISLFHLGEYWNGKGDGMNGERSPDAPFDDAGLLRLMLSKLNVCGRIGFYRNSAGWTRTEPLIEQALTEGLIHTGEDFESLRFFRRSDVQVQS